MKKLYHGGTIITMEEPVTVGALVTDEDRIVALGTFEELKTEYPEAECVDLNGLTLMPAFIDPHSHITMTANMMVATDLTECLSFEDIVTTLKKDLEKKQLGKDDVLIGFGYDHNVLKEEKHPTKDILDRVSKEVPIFITHVSGHMGCGSSKVLELAHITEDTKDPEGGKFGRVDGTMEPNGYFEEGAMMQLYQAFGSRMQVDTLSLLKEAEKLYASYGITTVQDGASTKETVELLKLAGKHGILYLDVVAYPLYSAGAENIIRENMDYTKFYHNHLKIGGYKLILDGSPQGKSAWMTRPYENSGDYAGYPWMKDEDVLSCIESALNNQRQVLAHCNGDAASDQYLRCYQKALEKKDDRTLRPVMIHCQTVRKDQLELMKEIGMIPSIFVGHTYFWGDVHVKNFGLDRGTHISPAGSALKLGLPINFHQDTPVTKPNMMHSVWCAVNRISRSGKVLAEEERISVLDALKAVTIGSAYEYFEEDEKGSLKVGKKADFAILDQDPLTIDPMELKDIVVMKTIKDGEVIYER